VVKQIKWTIQAKVDRVNILDFFIKRNQSTTYSQKLNRIFIKEINLISLHPNIGKKSTSLNIRVKISGNYYIIYMIDKEVIYVLRIWDTRQNPIKLIQIL
jgi:toxin YoeB